MWVAAAAVAVNFALPCVPPASQEEKSVGCQLLPLGIGSRGVDFWMANHDHVVLATSSDATVKAANTLLRKANVQSWPSTCGLY